MVYNLRKTLAFLFISGIGISLISVVLAQSGQQAQMYVSSSYGTWPGYYPYYPYYPDYPHWTGYYPFYPYYYPYSAIDGGGVEMRPGEATAEWLFNQGIGEPWIGGDPPSHSRWYH